MQRLQTVFWSLCGGMISLVLLLPGGIVSGAAPFPRGQGRPTGTPGGVVLFEDDFATYSNRWEEYASPKSSAAYRDGALVLRVVSPGVSVWSVPDYVLSLKAYTLQVTAIPLAGSADSAFGCVLAYENDDSFYVFRVTLDGTWQFLHYAEGGWRDLTPEALSQVSFARGGEYDRVHLQVDVLGDTLAFTVNGAYLGTVSVEDDLPGSGFGVIAHAGHGYVEVLFETVVVSELAGDMERGTTN